MQTLSTVIKLSSSGEGGISEVSRGSVKMIFIKSMMQGLFTKEDLHSAIENGGTPNTKSVAETNVVIQC